MDSIFKQLQNARDKFPASVLNPAEWVATVRFHKRFFHSSFCIEGLEGSLQEISLSYFSKTKVRNCCSEKMVFRKVNMQLGEPKSKGTVPEIIEALNFIAKLTPWEALQDPNCAADIYELQRSMNFFYNRLQALPEGMLEQAHYWSKKHLGYTGHASMTQTYHQQVEKFSHGRFGASAAMLFTDAAKVFDRHYPSNLYSRKYSKARLNTYPSFGGSSSAFTISTFYQRELKSQKRSLVVLEPNWQGSKLGEFNFNVDVIRLEILKFKSEGSSLVVLPAILTELAQLLKLVSQEPENIFNLDFSSDCIISQEELMTIEMLHLQGLSLQEAVLSSSKLK